MKPIVTDMKAINLAIVTALMTEVMEVAEAILFGILKFLVVLAEIVGMAAFVTVLTTDTKLVDVIVTVMALLIMISANC